MKGSFEITILGVKLVETCSACPEQYNVYDGEEQIGYLRLRHGCFRADYPVCGGETVYYSEEMKGDGRFEDDEREYFLTYAVQCLKTRRSNNDTTESTTSARNSNSEAPQETQSSKGEETSLQERFAG